MGIRNILNGVQVHLEWIKGKPYMGLKIFVLSMAQAKARIWP